MNNLLIAIGVLIVLVLSALFSVPYFVDWNSWRGVIEEEASRLVGRDVRIGGDITAQLLPTPAFTIQKLRVADVATGTGEPLFRAERFEVRLSIAPLFRGVLEASQIELVKPALRLVVDDEGRGNWRSIVHGQGALPFAPSAVALQSVKITDGTVSAHDKGGNRERLKLEQVEGQLSAPALEGPYRFRGTFGAADGMRELRFTTLPPDADGLVQIKAGLKDIASGATASLDGRLRNPSGQPELTGDLTAQLPLPMTEPTAAKPQQRPVAELKAAVVGTVRQVALNNLSLAFESSGRPEVLTGGATFNFDGELRTVTSLAAPWIDLDTVLGNPEDGNALLALAEFAKRVNSLGVSAGRSTATLQIDQANLGRDLISGVRVEVQTSAGVLAIEQMRANLPGGTKIDLQGRLTGEGAATTFDGDLTLRATSFARLAGWASAGKTAIDPANDVPLQLRSRVTAEPARGGLRDIVATLGDSALEGEVDYAWKGSRVLRVSLSGPRIDARMVAPSKASLRSLAAALVPGKSTPGDLTVALAWKTPELILSGQTFRDVAASIERSQSGLRIERLQFSGDHGIAVSLEGRVGGDMRGSLAAADAEGLSTLSDFVEFPLSTLLPPALGRDAYPLKLAGTITFGSAADAKAVAVVADGSAGDIDTKVRFTLSGGLEAWRTSPADVDVVLIGPPKARLAAKVMAALRKQTTEKTGDSVTAARLAAVSDKAGTISRLAVRAVGIPADGLSTAIRFDSADVGALIDGSSRIAGSGSMQLTGEVTLEARDGRDAVSAMSGIDLAVTAPLNLQGTMRMAAADGAVSLSKIALTANGNSITGRIDLDTPDATARAAGPAAGRVRGELTLATADAATLLGFVLREQPSETQAAIQVTSGRIGLWPEVNFDFGRNAGVAAEIALKIGKLVIADGVGVSNADLKLTTRPGALEVRDLTGTALGGRLAFSGVLDRTQSGAAMTAKLQIEGAQLTAFGSTSAADVALTLTGSGLSPAGLVSGVIGSGTLALTSGGVREINPATLQAAIETAFKAPPERLGNTLQTALGDDGARSTVVLGPRTVALAVRDGAIRILPITVAAAPGRIITQAALDLATFRMTGEWRVETRLPPLPALPPVPGQPAAPTAPTAAALLPPLVQRFALAPSEIGTALRTTPPAIDTSALERELAVRKVERDLAELERLRRLDEERIAAQKAAAEQAEWARQINVQPTAPPQIPQPQPAARPPQ